MHEFTKLVKDFKTACLVFYVAKQAVNTTLIYYHFMKSLWGEFRHQAGRELHQYPFLL